MTKFKVFTFGNTFVVMWLDDGLGCKVSAIKDTSGAMYGREVEPGLWRYRPITYANRITFREIRQLSSLVQKMMLDDTLPEV